MYAIYQLFAGRKADGGPDRGDRPSPAKAFIRSIEAKIEAYAPQVCVLDFQEVSFVDSSGIAVVINALRCMTRLEGTLMLTGLGPAALRVSWASGH